MQRIVADVDGEAAALCVEDAADHLPGAKRRDLSLHPGLLIQELEDGDVWIWFVVIGVDARISMASQGFAVARVGEVEAVGHVRIRAGVAIAVDLPAGDQRSPEKGKKSGATLFRSGGQELLAKGFRIAIIPVGLRREQSGVGAPEDLLPTKAVGHDDQNIVSRGRLLGERHPNDKDKKDETERAGEAGHERAFTRTYQETVWLPKSRIRCKPFARLHAHHLRGVGRAIRVPC